MSDKEVVALLSNTSLNRKRSSTYKVDQTTSLTDAGENGNTKQRSSRNEAVRTDVSLAVSDIVVLLLASVCAHFLVMGFSYGLGVLYPEFVRVYGSERTLAALVQSLYLSLNISGGGLWNAPVQRFGVSACAMCGGLLVAVGVAINSLFTNIWVAIVSIGIVSGLGASIINIAPFLILNKLSWKNKSNVMPIIPIGSSLGSFSYSYISEQLLQNYGLQGTQLILSAVLLNILPLSLIWYYTERRVTSSRQSDIRTTSLFSQRICTEWRFHLISLNLALTSIAVFVEPKFIVDLMVQKGYERETGSNFVAYNGILNACGRTLGVLLKCCMPGHSSYVMSVSMLVNAVSHALVIYVGTYPGMMAGVMLAGLSHGVMVSRIAVIAYEVFDPQLYAAALVGFNITGGLSGILGGYVGGLVNDLTGTYHIIFLIAIVCSLVNTVSFFVVGVSKTKYFTRHEAQYERLPD